MNNLFFVKGFEMELYATPRDFAAFKLLESRLFAIQARLLGAPLFEK